MAAGNFQTLTRRRAERARELSSRYPASGEALAFLARVADFQAAVDPSAPFDSLDALVELTRLHGPAGLAEAGSTVDPGNAAELDPADPRSFFARVLLQPALHGASGCEHQPQAGLLKPLAHGQALWLVCARCLQEWEHPRTRCVSCGETNAKKLAYHRAEQIAHIQVMSCDECRQYVHLIDLDKDAQAVGDIDEVAALPLDVWAVEQGYHKIYPNLVGL